MSIPDFAWVPLAIWFSIVVIASTFAGFIWMVNGLIEETVTRKVFGRIVVFAAVLFVAIQWVGYGIACAEKSKAAAATCCEK